MGKKDKKVKKEKKGGKRMTKKQLVEKLTDLIQLNAPESVSLKRIYADLKLNTHPLKMLCLDILQDMLTDDFICEPEKGRYKLKNPDQVVTGTFQRKSNGKNSLLPEDGSTPIFVAERNSAHAMNNDKVRVALFARRKNREREGEVIEILERANDTFVGRLKVDRHYAFLLTESRTLANDIFIPKERLKGAKDGDKVVVRVAEWPDDAKNPIGQVIDVLGRAGDNTTEMHAILAEYGLPYSYPENVEHAAEQIPAEISAEDLAEREDFRDVLTFTIDPKDAKDFDDALSIRRVGDGLWEVGVHIADVSHYVKEGSIIDKEAFKRATSVYLVDRTVPMLPERLCNFICSLRPDEEKLAYSVIFRIDDKGNVRDSHIAHTVIRSNRRFTYEEVQDILEARQGEYAAELMQLNTFAKTLRERRMAAGAINFDRMEVRFEIDEATGRPLSVYFKVQKDAHKLVEEFMLLANRTVAERIGKVRGGAKPKVFPYRIHDLPDPEKLEDLKNFIVKFGYKLKTAGSKTDVSRSLNHLLDEIQGKKEENLIETVSLRAMQKARYSTFNIGHYGLAFDYYTHFTSPIRRYPDMMVHRLLARYLAGGKSADKTELEELCARASEREVVAAEAERASIKYKMVEFMKEHIGEEFEGHISGLTEWGVYVELDETHIEGMSFLRDIEGDFFQFDEQLYEIIGRSTGIRLTLGSPVRIRVKRADLQKRQLDFEVLLPDAATRRAAAASEGRGKGPKVRTSSRRKGK